MFKRLRFAGVTIVTLSEGGINELYVGLKGTMNALFIKDLAIKTHRGQCGRVEAGKSGSRRAAYGIASSISSTLTVQVLRSCLGGLLENGHG